ncbi:hypothetical protein HNP81_000244 [Peribacillus huizhouensis]|uniref:Uncharacterized protein n=1 Tax=Peribacillus huizhouensis TaxID=1501239 RepID=A0ABR6CJ00_9BACI|nr:hypothetical protein [Peribacillus huizhouensis]
MVLCFLYLRKNLVLKIIDVYRLFTYNIRCLIRSYPALTGLNFQLQGLKDLKKRVEVTVRKCPIGEIK